jgi:uncharacterized protein YcfL
MKLCIRPIFSKTIIILMMFFLCLPCSAKNEIKQSLNASAANIENTTKSNKLVVCQSFTKKATQKISVSFYKKNIQVHQNNYFFDFQQPLDAGLNATPFIENVVVASVPIYLLHEQYLI